ncbi:hypothetical protein Cni_G05182 [Canna indica]|uniref:Glycine-rich protein n=1 Tax=Canna indica TaxID=4628 RepID=A0AAQ3Q4P5_9LILI|nr:hypothetical protein Cni_G05182 [Canna indica]
MKTAFFLLLLVFPSIIFEVQSHDTKRLLAQTQEAAAVEKVTGGGRGGTSTGAGTGGGHGGAPGGQSSDNGGSGSGYGSGMSNMGATSADHPRNNGGNRSHKNAAARSYDLSFFPIVFTAIAFSAVALSLLYAD